MKSCSLPPIEHFGILLRRILHPILRAWMLARTATLLVAAGASPSYDGVYRDDAPVALDVSDGARDHV